MAQKGLFTSGDGAQSLKGTQWDPEIPLTEAGTDQQTVGQIVSEASYALNNLVRGEIELAKAEAKLEAKKAAIGGAFFGVAAVLGLISGFFFLMFLTALIAVWLPWWAAFLIVFVVMLVIAGVAAIVGFKAVKKLGAPKATIASVKDLKELVPGKKGNTQGGMYS